ncbi:MAG: tRNA pseudouridine55 synthase [Rickettsiales bacterium]|jgi:tRNA pseudouridine55 synthase
MESKNINIDKENFWLNIDKPEDYSSAKIVAIVKRLTNSKAKSKKVGHAGTLDPFATGVLPIAVGQATRTCDYVVGAVKKYYFEITWGEFRDSDDRTGNVIESSDERPSNLDIINSLPKFIGTIYQVPSSFSAIKVDGKRSYELARQGIEVKLKSRQITINKIKLIFNNHQKSAFEIVCSKGTYVRSFAKDLAREMGVCGYVQMLRRLQVGSFLSDEAISLDKLKNIVKYNAQNNFFLQLRDVLSFIPEIKLNSFDASKIKNGQFVELTNIDNLVERFENKDIPTVKIISEGVLVGLAKIENDLLKPFNNF